MKQEKPDFRVFISAFDGSKALVLGSDIVAKKKYGEPLVYQDKITKKSLVVFDDSCLPSRDFEPEVIYSFEPF